PAADVAHLTQPVDIVERHPLGDAGRTHGRKLARRLSFAHAPRTMPVWRPSLHRRGSAKMDQLLPLPELPAAHRRAGLRLCRLRGREGHVHTRRARLLQLIARRTARLLFAMRLDPYV